MEPHISLARRLIGDLLLILAVLLTADVLSVMPAKIHAVVLKADYQKVFVYELIVCAVLLLFALDVRFRLLTGCTPIVLKGIGWVLRAVLVLLSCVILFFCGKVITGGVIRTAASADYAVVLGLALENGEPAPDLLSRLETAAAWLQENPHAKLILTGGNADASGRTEADVMADLLIRQGVPEGSLILEDRAETTNQNFRNIAGMISKDTPLVLISSDYHMDRAVRIADKEGFTHVLRLPAPSRFSAYGASMLSEVVLDLNDLTKRKQP